MFVLQVDFVEVVEDLIEFVGLVVCVVWGGCGSYYVVVELVVEGGGLVLGQWLFDVVEENDVVVFGGVFCVVDEGFIEYYCFVVVLVVVFVVYFDEVGWVVGGEQFQVEVQ